VGLTPVVNPNNPALEPFKPYLLERWNDGCCNASVMRDIRSLLFVISKESSG
jgi:hypothetical protein